MLRRLAPAIALALLAQPVMAADPPRMPSSTARAEGIADFDRPLTYLLMAALIAAIVIATADDGSSDDSPASP